MVLAARPTLAEVPLADLSFGAVVLRATDVDDDDIPDDQWRTAGAEVALLGGELLVGLPQPLPLARRGVGRGEDTLGTERDHDVAGDGGRGERGRHHPRPAAGTRWAWRPSRGFCRWRRRGPRCPPRRRGGGREGHGQRRRRRRRSRAPRRASTPPSARRRARRRRGARRRRPGRCARARGSAASRRRSRCRRRRPPWRR